MVTRYATIYYKGKYNYYFKNCAILLLNNELYSKIINNSNSKYNLFKQFHNTSKIKKNYIHHCTIF